MVRTQPSQGWYTGSTPVRAASAKRAFRPIFATYSQQNRAAFRLSHASLKTSECGSRRTEMIVAACHSPVFCCMHGSMPRRTAPEPPKPPSITKADGRRRLTTLIERGEAFLSQRPLKEGQEDVWSTACLETIAVTFGEASSHIIVRPSESTAETQPQLHPALLRLSATISQYFTRT